MLLVFTQCFIKSDAWQYSYHHDYCKLPILSLLPSSICENQRSSIVLAKIMHKCLIRSAQRDV